MTAISERILALVADEENLIPHAAAVNALDYEFGEDNTEFAVVLAEDYLHPSTDRVMLAVAVYNDLGLGLRGSYADTGRVLLES